MQRGSDKHGPRMDDELRKESESIQSGVGTTHVEPWRQPEPLDPEPEADKEPPPVGPYERPRGEVPPEQSQ